MALTTKIPLRYRTPHIPGMKTPDVVLSSMRKEITAMRKDLIKKQERLAKNSRYSHNPKLLQSLKETKVKNLHTDKQVQDTWMRLRSLELSNRTSVKGHIRTAQKTQQTFKEQGFDISLADLARFGNFLQWVKSQYGDKVLSSDVVLEYVYENKGLTDEELEEGFERWADEHMG